MPEKIKKNLLGRTVVKNDTKYGDKSVSRRTVYGRDGKMIKSRTVGTNSKTGERETRLTSTKKGGYTKSKKTSMTPSGEKMVVKKKSAITAGGGQVMKQTTKTGAFGKKSRMVKSSRVGEKFTATNLGAVSQGRFYRSEKNKK